MKTIITEKDISALLGKFVVELNVEDELKDITNITKSPNPFFYIEKRIRWICKTETGTTLAGPYYSQSFENDQEFIDHWNNFERGRFYRFMSRREIAWYFQHLYDSSSTWNHTF